MICKEKIDILLPTFNGEKYVKQLIISLLNQTYNNIVIYVRDDKSIDSTVNIITELSKHDPRIIIINDNLGNLGLVANINNLLGHSDSDYIMYCDQDDVWFPNKVEILIKELQSKENLLTKNTSLLIHSDCYVTDENLVVKGFFQGKRPYSYDLKNSLFKYYVQGASSIFNKSLKNEIYPFLDNVYIHDRYTHLISEIIGKRFYISKPLMHYRQHSSNLIGSSTIYKKFLNSLNLKNLNYFVEKDRKLIETLYHKKFPEEKILEAYLKITSLEYSKILKIKLLIEYNITMRLKEFILFLIKK